MGESERGADEVGAPEAGALPEGGRASSAAGPAADSTSREGLPSVRGGAHAAGNLDLLVELDEPEQLMRELHRMAAQMRDKGTKRPGWSIVVVTAHDAIKRLEELNSPPNRD